MSARIACKVFAGVLAACCGMGWADAGDAEFVVRPSDDWIPVTSCVEPQPGSALDFSGLGFVDGPCGKYGRIVARGQNFEYEGRPGVAQRFYGVNLCTDCTTLPKGASRQLVENLIRSGYNTVRIHHYENSLLKPTGDRMDFDPEALDRFDALFAECRARGVYVTTDLFVSRTVVARACGLDSAGKVDDVKVLALFHPGVHSNYLAFAQSLLAHRNPYTGLTYAEDPTLAWISLVNEGNLPNFGEAILRKHAAVVRPHWESWLARRRAADESLADIPATLPETLSGAATNRHVAAFHHFLADREARFARKMRRWLRTTLNCRALVTDMNCWTYPSTLQPVRAENYDYVDDHFYYTHPSFLGPNWCLPARVPGGLNIRNGYEAGIPYVATRRLLDRPFTVSEYNYCPPGSKRCAGGFLCGAAAALQNWAALWHFDWTCSARGAVGTPLGMNHFDVAPDPISLGADRLFVCLFLRRDLPPLARTFATLYPPRMTKSLGVPVGGLQRGFPWAGWCARIGGLYAEALPDGWESMGNYVTLRKEDSIREELGRAVADEVCSPDGGFKVDCRNETVILRTARTAGGFLPSDGCVEAGALVAEIASSGPTAVWASSLSDAPLARAPRILCAVLTDVLQDGMRFRDASRDVLLAWGRGDGKLMRRARVRFSLACEGPAEPVAYSLNPDGSRRRRLVAERRAGRLCFAVDTAGDGAESEYLFEVVR